MLNIVVLYGLGGMGKTQLALEYVYQYYHDYSSVFWVNAASVQTTILGFMQILQQIIEHHLQLSEDIAKIARLLGMAGKLDSTGCFTVTSESEAQHVVHAVKRWFSMPQNTNWLLVFDNLDDLDLVDIEEYLPLCNHGTVIITSRRRDIIQHGRRGFEVEQMHPAEAIQLLLIAYAIQQATANTIAQELGYLPLALSQAGAYIHISQYSLSRYLKEYQANASHLLNQEKMRSHDRSVFATWEISFKAIQEKNPKAAELLLVCGFFDHEDIPEVLLRRGLKLEADVYERDCTDLIDIATEAFGIVASIVGSFAERCTEDWIFEQQLMLHIDAVTRYMPQYLAKGNIEIQDGANGLGAFYLRHGWYDKATEWYMRALDRREKELGVDNPSTLTTVHSMASVFSKQGQYDKALEWSGRVLAGREKALGVDHPSTLTTVHQMASVFSKQGQYDKALEWFGRVLAGEEKALGVDHPDTLTTVHSMALVFSKQGQYDKALECPFDGISIHGTRTVQQSTRVVWRVLAGKEKALGVDHPDTLTTVHWMASVFLEQGQYDKALEWYGRVLAGVQKALGVDHPDTLTTVHWMALVFSEQGQYGKALEWYGRVLAGREKALGVNHPSTLTTVHEMASVFSEQGQYDKALEWYGRVLAGKEKALGVDHPRTLTTVHEMASVFSKQGQYDKALEWYGRVLAGSERALGVDHPATLTTVHQMASVFSKQGQYDKALEWYGRVLTGSEKALGVDHPQTLTTVHSMASVFSKQGRLIYLHEEVGQIEQAQGLRTRFT
ncbi:hypothetical protein EV426DRAFT_577675 [Tirmania nivea]|nr:hypothetical protein EV426DRAFT_577675 [Tirmania nivea]